MRSPQSWIVCLLIGTFSVASFAAKESKGNAKKPESPPTAAQPAPPSTPVLAPGEIEITYACKEALALEGKEITLLDQPSSAKTKTALGTWHRTRTPNDEHPAVFTYSVPQLTKDTKPDAVEAIVRKVVISAVLTDDFVKKGALSYQVVFKRLETKTDTEAAVGSLIDYAGLGSVDKLIPQMQRVFEGVKKRTLYSGWVNADMKGMDFGGEFVLVVDTEYSEVSAIAHGDLFSELAEFESQDP